MLYIFSCETKHRIATKGSQCPFIQTVDVFLDFHVVWNVFLNVMINNTSEIIFNAVWPRSFVGFDKYINTPKIKSPYVCYKPFIILCILVTNAKWEAQL